jgi:aldehyde dehydrogenase (NAD+)
MSTAILRARAAVTSTVAPVPSTSTVEDSKPATDWIASHNNGLFGMFINGEWKVDESRDKYASIRPATGETMCHTTQGTNGDIDDAIKAARAAAGPWAALSGHERAKHIHAIVRGLQKHAGLLALVEAMDNGKPIGETANADIPLTIRHFAYHAGWAQVMEEAMPNHKPVGVIGQIIPWNFPLLMLAWKVAPALAMGNTLVLKPAPSTRLTAALFCDILMEVGLPPGVVNIVSGDNGMASHLANHPGVDKVAFTGSTNVGKLIQRQLAGTNKKLSLELGGKAPVIVYESADLDAAVEGIVTAIWFNQGQVCCAGSRLLVQESVRDELVAKLKVRMEKLKVGDSLDKTANMGAIIDDTQKGRIEEFMRIGKAEGAEIYQVAKCPKVGCFFPPTIVTNVDETSTLVKEEIFGPVLTVLTFKTPNDAIRMANNTNYGLSAGIWTKDINLAHETAISCKAGIVWVNCHNMFDAAAGFGGYKESGFGREGGREGLNEYAKYAWKSAGVQTVTQAIKDGEADWCKPKSGDGGMKDAKDAVDTAVKAFDVWGRRGAYDRAQVLFYLAEDLAVRQQEFAERLDAVTGCGIAAGNKEVEMSISRLFTYAAHADKMGGAVQEVPMYGLTLGVNEPVGVIGMVLGDDCPLLQFVSCFAPAICRGNTVVIAPSVKFPKAANDLFAALAKSDLPAGVLNILSGEKSVIAKTLAEHEAVNGMWYFGDTEGCYNVQKSSAVNMKRLLVCCENRDWMNDKQSQGEEFLKACVEVKNIWFPITESKIQLGA